MKRTMALALTLIMMISIALPMTFADSSKPSTWAEEQVAYMIEQGLVPENLQSNYQQPITREEFTQLVIPLLEGWIGVEIPIVKPEFDDTSAQTVIKAYSADIVSGVGNNKFNPNGLITREQIAIMYLNTLEFIENVNDYADPERVASDISYSYMNAGITDFSTVSSWAKGQVTVAFNNKILSGVEKDKVVFAPKKNATREQAILIGYNVLMNLSDENHVTEINEASGDKIAFTLPQAIYLGAGKKAVKMDLLTLFGKEKVEAENVFGKADSVNNLTDGYHNEIYSAHELIISYNQDDIIIGATISEFEGNKVFTGTMGDFHKSYTKEEAVALYEGEFVEMLDYGLITYVFEMGDEYFVQLIWNYETGEFIGVSMFIASEF